MVVDGGGLRGQGEKLKISMCQHEADAVEEWFDAPLSLVEGVKSHPGSRRVQIRAFMLERQGSRVGILTQ